jgi:hypothetical protein
LGIMAVLAGRGDRMSIMGIKRHMATAKGKSAPGNECLEFMRRMAGRGGRKLQLEFMAFLATAFTTSCFRA